MNLAHFVSAFVLLFSLIGTSSIFATDAESTLRIICFGAHPDDAEYKSEGRRRFGPRPDMR